ncbi:uncharacterized protein HaLaN_01244, partial [Haematococcus lacustris]
MHNDMANKVTGGRPELLLGVIMDSPSVNRAALYLLERDNPTWICMTCCVHAMNLICKDLANESKTLEKHVVVGDFLKQVQLIAKVLGDCGKVRNAFNCAQMIKYQKIHAVATHCATRFAILYLICVDLKRSEDAFVMMVHSGEWESLRTASTNASVFEELKSPSWWRKLDAVIRLMKPISNAIHRLEGDTL